MIEAEDLRFDVVVSGKPDTLCFLDSWRLVWKLRIGWVVRSGFYRYGWEGYQDEQRLADTGLSATSLRFGLKLHQHRPGHPVIAGDFQRSQENPNPPSKNAFTAWPARWRVHVYKAIPEGLRSDTIPFERVPVPAQWDDPAFGYQLRDGVTCILVLDLVADLKRQGVIFDWDRFLQPYKPDSEEAA